MQARDAGRSTLPRHWRGGPRLLIASHIKPCRNATNPERFNGYNGYNGIMLSPHIDALLDERLIAFENDGRMLVHRSLTRDVLDR